MRESNEEKDSRDARRRGPGAASVTIGKDEEDTEEDDGDSAGEEVGEGTPRPLLEDLLEDLLGARVAEGGFAGLVGAATVFLELLRGGMTTSDYRRDSPAMQPEEWEDTNCLLGGNPLRLKEIGSRPKKI